MAASEYRLEDEYKKDTGITEADVQALREWVKAQPHLPSEHITDLDLILAYHCCNRSSAVTKQVMDLNYTLRTHLNFFKNRQFDNRMEQSLDVVLMKPLPTRSHEGNACLFVRLVDTDPRHFVFADAMRLLLMVTDLWQYEEGTWPGFMLVVDLETLMLGHIAALEIQYMQQFFYYLQEAMLVKLKGFHFINAPTFMDKLMMLIRPFLKKELLESFQIHQKGSKTIDKFYPIEALPLEAGGKYKSVQDLKVDVLKKIKANSEFFALENKKRVTESKRPGKPKTVTDFFGSIEGSFKKLDID